MKISTQKTRPLIAIVCVGGCALAAGTSVFADEVVFKTEKLLTITRAVDLVSDGGHKVTKVGEELTLTNRETTRAREIRRKGFQVRVFSLRPNEVEPGIYAPPIEDCLIFWSLVIPIPGSNDFKIDLGEITEGWLVSRAGREFEYGYYLLVFEERGSSDRIFRIRKSHAKQYFENGMRLTITYDGNLDLTKAEILAKQKEKIRTQLEGAAKLNRPDIPCYEYQSLQAADAALPASAGVLKLCVVEYIPGTS